jgi:hypothetical protein
MRTVSVHEWFDACTPEERSAMEAWFERNGIAWVGGRTILERRCGVTLLGMRRQDGRTDYRHLPNGELVLACRPQSALSEEPFPWPEVAR